MKLQGKIALITGASSGIGKATAHLFAEEGATVILAARDKSKLDSVQKEIADKGFSADSVSIDIADLNSVQKGVSEMLSKHSKIDILVNNAGIFGAGSILEVSPENFYEQVQVNLNGCFNMIKVVSPHMVDAGSGSVVNIITSTVKNTKANRVAYAASKYGQAGLSNAVHEDLKEKGISVVAVYPGKADTPIHDSYLSEDDPKRKEMLTADAVAGVILEAALKSVSDDCKELVINP